MHRTVDLSPIKAELVCRYATYILRNTEDFVGAEVKAARELQNDVVNAETTHAIGKES